MKPIIYLLLLFPLSAFAQKTNDIINVRAGYNSTNILFKEAMELEEPLKFFKGILHTGKIFDADGPEFGISKNISNKLFAEVSFSPFSGKERTMINNNENYYTLKGFFLPVTLNYLTGAETKRLRVNLGGGVQYLEGHLKQYEITNTGGGQATNKLTDIKISEFQFALRPGLQYRIIPDLYASFLANLAVSANGRLSDHPSLSLKYTISKKQGN
jgi:hypothetical protein